MNDHTNKQNQPTQPNLLVPKSAIDWLLGEGPDANGGHFGDNIPERAPRYWWRSHFRKLIADMPSAKAEETKEDAYTLQPFTVTIWAEGDGENTAIEAVHHALSAARSAGHSIEWGDAIPVLAGEAAA